MNQLLETIIGFFCSLAVALIVMPLTFLFAPLAKYNSGYRNYTFWTPDTVLAWALARVITLLPNYLSVLKKLEIGVFFFCWRLYREAREATGLEQIAEALKAQAISEYSHAQVFCQATGSKLYMSGAGLMSREEKAAFDWGCVNWDSSGESYQADGMSTRYLSAKIFFWFRTANSYSWCDRLALMYVLEELQTNFYRQLIRFVGDEIEEDLRTITQNEQKHALSLHSLFLTVTDDEKIILKWQIRKYLALLAVPIDAIILFGRTITCKP